jgi:hypothetical protein
VNTLCFVKAYADALAGKVPGFPRELGSAEI